MTLPPSGTSTLAHAKEWLRARVWKGGDHCPCCGQFAKVYRRPINSTMARTLITLWNTAGTAYAHGPSLAGDTHEISQLSWWGLVEEESVQRPDGGRAGWWRITPTGIEWVRSRITVPKYACIYDGRCLKLEGDPESIKTALGRKFNLQDLMERAWETRRG